MEKRNLFVKMFGNKKQVSNFNRYQMLNSSTNSFYAWNDKAFDSDIVRSAIRPKANAIGKLNPKHIVGFNENMRINSIPYIREILERPNPYMSMQELLTKLTFQREIYHNAFAWVKRDDNFYITEIYPMPYSQVEVMEKDGNMFVKFKFRTGQYITVPYEDVIHLRKDFNEHDVFGDNGTKAISGVMEVITTTDQGVVNAVKNSAIIKWILKFTSKLRPEDIELQKNNFAADYLNIERSNGVMASDPSYNIEQVNQINYVPNAAQMKESVQRLYSYFGVNDAIVQNKYKEDEWNAFYESEIEPLLVQLSNAFTNVFFSKRERAFGNKIVFESSNLQYASMSTKLGLVQMVDRGAMTPNEWRSVLNLGPIEGGDKPIRRLDTAVVQDKSKTNGDDNSGTDTTGKDASA